MAIGWARDEPGTPSSPGAVDVSQRQLLEPGGDELIAHLDHLHRRHLADGSPRSAARDAVWAGVVLAVRAEPRAAEEWFTRARRLLDEDTDDHAEPGYALVPELLVHAAAGRWTAVTDAATAISGHARSFDDRDLWAVAAMEHGHALVRLGRREPGFNLLDEAVLAAADGELSPVVTGVVFCGVIAHCRQLHDLRRAREWTRAFERWCASADEVVAGIGECRLHLAELLQARGSWDDALAAAGTAHHRFVTASRPTAAGDARVREAEVHRLRGEFDAADHAYAEAARLGAATQPGLALLRLAQGRAGIASKALDRVLDASDEPLERARYLPATVDVRLGLGDLPGADAAAGELQGIARRHPTTTLMLAAATATAAVALASGRARAALVTLRRVAAMLRGMELPYEVARARELLGLACRALGEEAAARSELSAARSAFAELGADPDRTRLERLLDAGPGDPPDTLLTPRELQVLGLLAGGRTNRVIATELGIGPRTVDRHVSNLLAKLDTPSRTAATAYAYAHNLV